KSETGHATTCPGNAGHQTTQSFFAEFDRDPVLHRVDSAHHRVQHHLRESEHAAEPIPAVYADPDFDYGHLSAANRWATADGNTDPHARPNSDLHAYSRRSRADNTGVIVSICGRQWWRGVCAERQRQAV